MTDPTAVALHRARGVVVVGLIGVVGASWAYLGLWSARSGDLSVLMMPTTPSWSAVQTTLMVTMWAVMMAAMMLPSAVPMVLTYDRLDRSPTHARSGSTVLFVTGYLTVWAAFALAATGLQWALHHMTLVNGMGEATRPLTVLLLVGAGMFQLSPTKRRSLGACRTPLGFLMTAWRDGATGALRMGLHHGTLCLGCCWALMLLLFVLGVMNLIWVAVLALFVVTEKVTRRGEAVSATGGLLLIAWGAAITLRG